VVIHLGANTAVRAEDILLMTDLCRELSADTERLIAVLRERHLVRSLSPAPKTLVLCQTGTRQTAYLSGVGLRTLSARAREDQSFFLRMMRQEQCETGQSEVQHVKRIGSGD